MALLRPSHPQAALADLSEIYGCEIPAGGQWFLHGPDGTLLKRGNAAGASASTSAPSAVPAPVDDEETLEDAHELLDTIANAPADIAIVYGTDGHSRATRIALEIADALARPLSLPGASKLLAAARILMDGGQGARSGEVLQHLKAARVAAQAAASGVQSWQADNGESADWPSSVYILAPEPEVQRLRARLRPQQWPEAQHEY